MIAEIIMTTMLALPPKQEPVLPKGDMCITFKREEKKKRKVVSTMPFYMQFYRKR